MSGSWPLFESRCNLDKVRLKTLDLQLSGCFRLKHHRWHNVPLMSQCLIQTACLTDQFQTQNPESSLSDKARSCPTDSDLDLILILYTGPLETLSYISSAMKKFFFFFSEVSIHTEWNCSSFFSLCSNKRGLSLSLLFRALAKTCWSSQSKPELIRITGMFNFNSGYCPHLVEHFAAYVQSRNCLLISKSFLKCGVQKLLHFW